MKPAFFALSILLVLTACNKSDVENQGHFVREGTCAGTPVVGRWAGKILGRGDVMTFSGDCTGSSTYCKAVFTYPNTASAFGLIDINVVSTAGNAGCLPKGTRSCGYRVRGNQLRFNCGGETLSFTRVE